MVKTVVVPLDGSKMAEVALLYAEEVAAKMGAEITLLRVLESEELGEYQNYLKYAQKIEERTKRHAEKYIEHHGGKSVKVSVATRCGSPAESIVDFVGTGPFCLVVMATHGRSGVNRWAIGSVADKVVRASTRQPVMLIRTKQDRSDIREKRILKKCLIPLDGSLGSEAVIPYVSSIAAKLEMEIILLEAVPRTNHVYEETKSYLQNISHKFDANGTKISYEVRVGAPADVIVDCADEFSVDLVAMTKRARGSTTLWPLGSVSQKVLLAGDTPLLLISA